MLELKKNNESLEYYIPKETLKEVIDVLKFGEKKHGDAWKDKLRLEHLQHASQHIRDYLYKSIADEETGKSNLAHAICRLLFALSLEIEDRK